MTKIDRGSDPIVFTDVEKQYGGLRPLRIRDLRIPGGDVTMLIGFDRPAAEVFVNLVTGAALPEKGEVVSLGRPTHSIADSEEWLSFVEHFGVCSDRIVLLDAMTVSQNLALSFDLEVEPVPAHILERVRMLAADVGIDETLLETPMAAAVPLLRSRVYLARALSLDPVVVVLEHPSAGLDAADAAQFAEVVKRVSGKRALTMVGLLMDERFAKATGGRLLKWQPATGDVRQASRFARGFPYF